MALRRKIGVPLKITTHRSGKRTKTVQATLLGDSNTDVSVSVSADAIASSSETVRAPPSFDNEFTCETAPAVRRRPYREIKQEQAVLWQSVLVAVLDTWKQMAAPSTMSCSQCGIATNSPIRCVDCGPNRLLCEQCEVVVHEYLLHKCSIWKVRSIKNCVARRS